MAVIKKPTLVVVAAVVAFPTAVIAFAIADHQSTPQIVRCIVAPGYALAVNSTFDAMLRSMTFRGNLRITMFTASAVNFVLYELLFYGLLARFSRRFEMHRGTPEQVKTPLANYRTYR